MSTEPMKSAVRRWIENGFNQKDLSAFDTYFNNHVVNHYLPPNLPPGLKGTKMYIAAFLSASPDLRVDIEDLLVEDNKTVLRWSARGTHTGELMGIPPTGKAITVTGIAIDRFENDQSVEHWEVFDQLGLMIQLGVVPAPGTA